MKFIPGDIVRYKNKTAKYRIDLLPNGKLTMRHRDHGMTYPIPCDANERLVKDAHDTTYRVPKENVRAFLERLKDPPSREMIMWIDIRMGKLRMPIMDTSGFDALKSAGKDDAVDALSYASMYEGSFDLSKDEAVAIRHNFHKAFPGMKYMGRQAGRMEGILNKTNNKENKMSIQINELVAKVTDNIKDAQLVTQYFGHELNENSIKDELFVKENFDELLTRAEKKEEERLAAEKSCA